MIGKSFELNPNLMNAAKEANAALITFVEAVNMIKKVMKETTGHNPPHTFTYNINGVRVLYTTNKALSKLLDEMP